MKDDRNRLSTRDIAGAAAARRDRLDEPRPSVTSPAPTTPERAATRTTTPATIDETHRESLFHGDEAEGFRTRWEAIQTGFVDEPRKAVEEADALVAQVVTRLAEVFNQEKTSLEQQWDRGDNISTEDLRISLRRYRSFFDRLLSV